MKNKSLVLPVIIALIALILSILGFGYFYMQFNENSKIAQQMSSEIENLRDDYQEISERIENVGDEDVIKGEKGDPGEDGEKGDPGKDGENGLDEASFPARRSST